MQTLCDLSPFQLSPITISNNSMWFLNYFFDNKNGYTSMFNFVLNYINTDIFLIQCYDNVLLETLFYNLGL